jgi:large subunit ribosomal protein L6
MSKIGRKPISFNGTIVTVNNNIVSYKGKEASGSYIVPSDFAIIINNDNLVITPIDEVRNKKDTNMFWGLHRALLNNAILGAQTLFEKQLKIDGLGFKAELQGNVLTFSLGFSHKIEYSVPDGVKVEVDKSKQNLIFKSTKKDLLGHVCSIIKDLKPAEPYKGKGISYLGEKIIRKAGKTK